MLPADICKSFPTDRYKTGCLKLQEIYDAEIGMNIPLQMDRWKKFQITFQIKVIN